MGVSPVWALLWQRKPVSKQARRLFSLLFATIGDAPSAVFWPISPLEALLRHGTGRKKNGTHVKVDFAPLCHSSSDSADKNSARITKNNHNHPPTMKTLTLIRAGMLSSVLAVLLSGAVTSQAAVIAALGADGTVYTADTANFAGTQTTLATLPTTVGQTYLDLTFGNGLVYGLRSDGAVYSSNLSGTTALVSTTGWTSAITEIDFANGTLFGFRNTREVIDASGAQRLFITNASGYVDFGVRDNGNISLLAAPAATFVFTFTNGYNGVQSGFAQFTNYVGTNTNPLALDVNGQFQTVLYTNTNTTLNESRYQDGTAAQVFLVNNTQSTELALSDDNSSVFFLASDFQVRTSLIASPILTILGDFGTATDGVGLVVVPEPSTWALLALGLTTVVVLRRRGRHAAC
jgi:hypothetical protein